MNQQGTTEVHRLWVDWLVRRTHGHYLVLAALVTISIFLAAFAVTWAIGFEGQFVRTPAIYLAHFGFFWVTAWEAWGTQRFKDIPSEIRGAFLVTDDIFGATVDAGLRRVYATKAYTITIALGIVASSSFIWFATHRQLLPWMPPDWSATPYLFVKNVILDVFYLVPISILVYTGAVGILRYASFVETIGKMPLHPQLDLARAKLRPIANFALAGGLAWSVGVTLFVLLFRENFNEIAIAVVSGLTILSFVMILWPQFALHRALRSERDRLLDLAIRDSVDVFRSVPLSLEHLCGAIISDRGQNLRAYTDWVLGIRTWAHDPKDVASFIVTWLIPVVTFLTSRSP